MVFLWFSYGFPMVFLWFSYGFPWAKSQILGAEPPLPPIASCRGPARDQGRFDQALRHRKCTWVYRLYRNKKLYVEADSYIKLYNTIYIYIYINIYIYILYWFAVVTIISVYHIWHDGMIVPPLLPPPFVSSKRCAVFKTACACCA